MLPLGLRRGFLEDFAREMKQHAEHGAGLVSRVARAIVQRYLNSNTGSSTGTSSSTSTDGRTSALMRSRASARASAEALFR